MNGHLYHPGSRRPARRGLGLWLSLLLGFLLAVIGLTSLNGRQASARHLLNDTTAPATAQQLTSHASARGTSVPSAETVHFTPQESDTTPVETF